MTAQQTGDLDNDRPPGPAPICNGCGQPKSWRGRGERRYWGCRPCSLEYLRGRRSRPNGVKPKSLAGARERLAKFLDERWDEALPRLAELLERSEAFGRSLKHHSDAA